jgi:hypothetical protein
VAILGVAIVNGCKLGSSHSQEWKIDSTCFKPCFSALIARLQPVLPVNRVLLHITNISPVCVLRLWQRHLQ